MVCVRAVTDHSSAIVVVVYRPGSVASHSTTNWPPFWIALPSTKNRSSSSATSTFVWTATMTHTPINYAYWSIVTGSCFTSPGQLISYEVRWTPSLQTTLLAVPVKSWLKMSDYLTIFYYTGRSMRLVLSDPPCLSAPAHGVAWRLSASSHSCLLLGYVNRRHGPLT